MATQNEDLSDVVWEEDLSDVVWDEAPTVGNTLKNKASDALKKADALGEQGVTMVSDAIKSAAGMQAKPKAPTQNLSWWETMGLTALDTAALGLAPQTLAVGAGLEKLTGGLDPMSLEGQAALAARLATRPIDSIKEAYSEYQKAVPRYREGLTEAQATQPGAGLLGTGLLGAASLGIQPVAGAIGSAARLGAGAVQGALGNERITQGDTSSDSWLDFLKNAGTGAALTGGPEAIGTGVQKAGRGLGRGMQAYSRTGNVGRAIKSTFTADEDRKLLEATLAKKLMAETSTKPRNVREYENVVKQGAYTDRSKMDAIQARLEEARRKDIDRKVAEYERSLKKSGEPKIALTPEQKVQKQIAKLQQEKASTEAAKSGALGQEVLNDIGYARDAVYKAGGSPEAALQDIIQKYGPDSPQAQNFGFAVSRAEEKLGERFGSSAEARVAAKYPDIYKQEVENQLAYLSEVALPAAKELDPTNIAKKVEAFRKNLEAETPRVSKEQAAALATKPAVMARQLKNTTVIPGESTIPFSEIEKRARAMVADKAQYGEVLKRTPPKLAMDVMKNADFGEGLGRSFRGVSPVLGGAAASYINRTDADEGQKFYEWLQSQNEGK